MCGICGYVNKKMLKKGILSEMNDTMYHRGPNDSGVWEQEVEDFTTVFSLIYPLPAPIVSVPHRRLQSQTFR